MSYTLTAVFENSEETERFEKFLMQEKVSKIIYELLKDERHPYISSENLIFGADLAYSPKIPAEQKVSTNSSFLPKGLFCLYVWLAEKSSYRVDGKPAYYYDDEVTILISPSEKDYFLKKNKELQNMGKEMKYFSVVENGIVKVDDTHKSDFLKILEFAFGITYKNKKQQKHILEKLNELNMIYESFCNGNIQKGNKKDF